MMNTKELRQLCNEILYGYQDVTSRACRLAKHVLATVRKDDDKSIDSQFLLSVGAITNDNRDYWITSAWGVSLICGEWVSMYTETVVKNRGQFRRLCEGLGIKLPP